MQHNTTTSKQAQQLLSSSIIFKYLFKWTKERGLGHTWILFSLIHWMLEFGIHRQKKIQIIQ